MKIPTPKTRSNWKMSGAVTLIGAVRDYKYRIGAIMTPQGIVALYDQVEPPLTSLSFVVGGRHLSASWDRTFTDRYLKTLAQRYAAECVGDPPMTNPRTEDGSRG